MGRGVLEKPITVELSFISIIKVEIIAIYFEVERNANFFYFGRKIKKWLWLPVSLTSMLHIINLP